MKLIVIDIGDSQFSILNDRSSNMSCKEQMAIALCCMNKSQIIEHLVAYIEKNIFYGIDNEDVMKQ